MHQAPDPTPLPPALAPADQDIFRRLVESVRDYAIFLLTPDGHIASWNEGAQRLKGYTAAQAIGKHFSMFYEADAVQRGWPQEELRRAVALGRFEDEGWRLRQDGSRFWANVIITPVYDAAHALIGFGKVTRDLTERRMQEERLRNSEEALRLLVEGVRDHAMFLVHGDGTIASWNLGAQRMLGFAETDMVGKPLACLYPEDDLLAGKARAELQSANETGFSAAEGWRLRADGSRLWTRSALTALYEHDGRLRGYALILRDLSEQLRMKELEDEGLRIHQFMAMLSHELRNPLTPISNAVEILRRTQGDPQARWCIDLISRQSEHLTRLVDDLLDASRVTSGKIKINSARLELGAVVRDAAQAQRLALAPLHQTLDLQLPTQPLWLLGDATRLNQVVSNLLTNAAKYTPQGGHIALKLEAEGDMARLTVSDNGIGMSPDLMQRAFDPFVQGSRSLERAGGGLGIGLTLVKAIVELHGGRVAVASEGAGRGTCFTLHLPLASAAPRPGEVDAAQMQPPPGTRVLVVDDNRDAADTLAELLRLQGHAVTLAYDGAQALSLAEREHPDIVLLDLGLPGMDGLEVARRLRAAPATATSRLIALTGYGQDSDRRATALAGFDAHLTKPVDVQALLRLVA